MHTSTNFTPYELLFGKKPIIPAAFAQPSQPQYNYDNYTANLKQTHKIARDNLIIKKCDDKSFYDRSSNALDLHVSDKVILKEHNKKNTLQFNWTSPFEITMVHDNENTTIKKGRTDYRTHINNVKKYFETDVRLYHTLYTYLLTIVLFISSLILVVSFRILAI